MTNYTDFDISVTTRKALDEYLDAHNGRAPMSEVVDIARIPWWYSHETAARALNLRLPKKYRSVFDLRTEAYWLERD